MESKARKYLTIIALGLAGGSIYFIPYVKYVFYDAQLAAMGINNTQSGLLLTMYTIERLRYLLLRYELRHGGWRIRYQRKKL